MTIQVSTSPNVCFCTTWENHNKRNLRWSKQKTSKTIHDIIDCNLKRDYQILIIFGRNIFDTTCYQMTVQVPTSPNVCFYATCEKQNKQNMCWNCQKNVNKFYLYGSVAPQQSVDYKVWLPLSSESARWRLGMLMNSISDWLSLDWSAAEHYRHCYQRTDKVSECLPSHKWPIFRAFTVSCWTTG